jgi:GH15 family glucan-1,4-alpha-glucosidase
LAFLHLGYYEEARAWGDWLHRAVAGSPQQVQIVYGIGGERRLPELTIPWLSGYENSTPVRVGNAASEQLQIDIFGEIADAIFQGYRLGLQPSKRGETLQPVISEYLATVWRLPDEGIWEIRGDPRHFVHSKVMAWVAFDRAAAYVEAGLPELSRKWREIADEIHADVCERGFDRELGSFVQAYGSMGDRRELVAATACGVPSSHRPPHPWNASGH